MRLLLAAGLAAMGLAGCLVDSRCQTDEDCTGAESCDGQSGRCRVECETETDCHVGGLYIGKECIDHRCEFRYDERVPAPNFCLQVVNPRSEHHGEDLCLADLSGKVVLIFFALLA